MKRKRSTRFAQRASSPSASRWSFSLNCGGDEPYARAAALSRSPPGRPSGAHLLPLVRWCSRVPVGFEPTRESTLSSNADMQRAAQRLGGTLRDKYRLDRVLGVGGMGAVYAATHRNQKQFAVKILHAEIAMVDDIRSRFLREGYVANTVNHPGAVSVLDDDIAEDGAPFLVMELLSGAPVDAIWEKQGRHFSLGVGLAVICQLLDILEAAHAKGIIHRDIKPPNLFLTDEGQLKVLDFGIARLHDGTANHMATGTGAMLGTPAFMAPEQAIGRSSEIDQQSDLWAVGATLFTLLSGQLVHQGDTAPLLLVQAATRPARSLSEVLPGAPPAVVDLVDRALAFDKASRWETAAVMRQAAERAHVELFGTQPSRDSLQGLVRPPSDAPIEPPSQVTMTAAPRPISRGPRAQSSPPASHSGSRTTANPVSRAPSIATVDPPRRAGWIGGTFVTVASWGCHFLPSPR